MQRRRRGCCGGDRTNIPSSGARRSMQCRGADPGPPGGPVLGVITRGLMDRELGHRGLTELVVVDDMHQRKALMASRASTF